MTKIIYCIKCSYFESNDCGRGYCSDLDIYVDSSSTCKNPCGWDLYDENQQTGEQYLQELREKEALEKALSSLSPKERKIYMEHRGLGEFEGRKVENFNALALNNNLKSAQEAQKIVGNIEEKLRKELTSK